MERNRIRELVTELQGLLNLAMNGAANAFLLFAVVAFGTGEGLLVYGICIRC